MKICFLVSVLHLRTGDPLLHPVLLHLPNMLDDMLHTGRWSALGDDSLDGSRSNPWRAGHIQTPDNLHSGYACTVPGLHQRLDCQGSPRASRHQLPEHLCNLKKLGFLKSANLEENQKKYAFTKQSAQTSGAASCSTMPHLKTVEDNKNDVL